MAVELAPGRAIVPIVRAAPERPVIEVLGTGFFVGNDEVIHLITAKHVIESNPLLAGEKYGIVFAESKGVKILATSRVLGCLDYDLAACEVHREDFPEAVTLMIGRVDAALNADVFSYEYSGTRIESSGTGTHVSFEPFAHKGNIVRSYESSYPEKVKTPSILTSFPALQGASGAPILTATTSRRSFAVVGMTVANVERHLLPAQVVRIQEGDSYREETSYFLPYGKALARSVVAKCLEGMKIPFLYAEDVESRDPEQRN